METGRFRALFILLLVTHFGQAQVIDLTGKWRFNIGDNPTWSSADVDDDHWELIRVPSAWEEEGFNGYDGFAWYRIRFDGRKLDKSTIYFLNLGYIDDADEAYLNNKLVGFSGQCPPPKFKTAYNSERQYVLPSSLINFDGENIIAVRVFDAGHRGGIVDGRVGIYSLERPDLLVDLQGIWHFTTSPNRNRPPKGHAWEKIMVPGPWEFQGHSRYDGFAWYRKEVTLPKKFSGETLVLMLGKIDDFDEVYFNGKRIGSTNDRRPYGLSLSYDQKRAYEIPPELVVQDGTNVIEVLVEDLGNIGGIYDGIIGIVTKREYEKHFKNK